MNAISPEVQLEARGVMRPWTFRWFDRCPWHPAIVGIAMTVLMLLAYAVVELLSGRPQALIKGFEHIENGCTFLLGDYRIGIIGIIILAASTTARYVLAEWTLDSMTRLGRHDFEDADSVANQHRWGFWPGLIGIVLCTAVAIDIVERDVEWSRDYWIFPHLFNWAWCVPFGWVGGRLLFSLIANAVAVSRKAESVAIRDLVRNPQLDIAVQHGSRSAFISLMFIGILSVHFLDPGLGLPTALFLIVLLIVSAGISSVPALGVVSQLYAFREEQLKILRSELDVEQEQLYAKDSGYEPGRIADIVAMEQRLQSWKIDVFHFSNIARIAIYALVGVVSWIGAAAVSVFVENLFQI